MKDYKYYFFDLDGTLTQSEFGIFESIRYALNKFGIEEEDNSKLKKFIGPPLFSSFKEVFGFSDEMADRAVAYYREFYNVTGFKNAPLYAGVKDTLDKLKNAGKVIALVTAKPEVMAVAVVENKEIRHYFKEIVGPELGNKNPDKTYLIERAMDLLNIDKNDPEDRAKVVMAGDRFYDIEAAVNAKVDSIGVLYGYGSEEELKEAGATYIVKTADKIFEI